MSNSLFSGGFVHAFALGLAILLTSFSQVLLRSGISNAKNILVGFFNPKTVFGYTLFLLVTLLTVFAMQKIPLRTLTAWNSTTYVLTLLLSHWILRENLNRKMILGGFFIIAGIVVFSL